MRKTIPHVVNYDIRSIIANCIFADKNPLPQTLYKIIIIYFHLSVKKTLKRIGVNKQQATAPARPIFSAP